MTLLGLKFDVLGNTVKQPVNISSKLVVMLLLKKKKNLELPKPSSGNPFLKYFSLINSCWCF